MGLELKARLEMLLKYLDMSQKKFSKVTGVSENTLSNAINKKNIPVLSFFNSIYMAFPELNPEWLYMGEGPMLQSEKEFDKSNFNDKETIEAYSKQIEIMQQQIADLKFEMENKTKKTEHLRK